jgi:hypothetical protein
LSANGNDDFGVAIDAGNTSNIIYGVGAQGNGTDDLFDAYADCDHDLSFFNFFTNANQACIE